MAVLPPRGALNYKTFRVESDANGSREIPLLKSDTVAVAAAAGGGRALINMHSVI